MMNDSSLEKREEYHHDVSVLIFYPFSIVPYQSRIHRFNGHYALNYVCLNLSSLIILFLLKLSSEVNHRN